MSEFHLVKLDCKDKSIILKSLKEMGYEPIEHSNSANLYGFQGDKRSQKAHIIIPRKQVGRASNDVGFELNENGEYTLHISEYDIEAKTFKQELFNQLYKKHTILNKLEKSLRYRMLENVKDANGNIKIRLSRKI